MIDVCQVKFFTGDPSMRCFVRVDKHTFSGIARCYAVPEVISIGFKLPSDFMDCS